MAIKKERKIWVESANFISENGRITTLVLRDPISHKNLVYIVKEASITEIVALMENKEEVEKKLSTG